MQPFVSFLPQQPFELGTSQQDQYKTYAEHLYAYVNAEDNQDYLNKSKTFFGELPKLSEQEDVYATFMGQQLVNMAGFGDTPELYMQAFNIEKPKNAFYRQELYQAIGKQFITKSRDDYKERKRKADEWQKKQTEAIKNARATIPAILASGRPLTAKDMQELTEAGLSDRFSAVAGDVQEAMDYLKTIVSPDPKALQDEAERVKKEWYDSVHLAWTKDRTDDEHMQQAAANLAKGYNLNREQLAHVLALLKDSKGNLDPETIGLFIATLNEKVNKEKTIDSAFWRNAAFGISDFAAASIDAQKRASTKRTSHGLNFVTGAGASLVGGNVGGYVTPTIEQQQAATSQFEKYYSSEMEQLRAGMLAVHDNALSPSDQSGWLAGALTMGGSIVGSEVIPFAVSTLATRGMGTLPSLIVGGAANAASRYPSAVSQNISTAYAQGKKNPEAYAAIYSIPQVGLESAFSAVGGTGVGKLGSELLWKAGKSIPGFARAAGAVQSSALLRWATGGAAEAFGELFIEDPAAELTSKAIFDSINAIAGRKVFDAPEWQDVKKALLSNVEDSRQAFAITAYAFALGAFGIGGDITKSRQFALSLENLKAAGHSIEAATEISRKAAQTEDKIQEIRANANISEIEKKKQIDELALSFTKWQQGKLRSDILDADYDTLAKRFAENSKEYLAQAEAKLYIETGATKAIHKQLGIRDEQPLPNGNHLISSMVEERKADGSTELKEERYELSESQYLNLIAFQNGKNLRRHYANYASALLGNAAVRKARSAENITHDLINIKDLANVSEAYTHIARKGAIDFQGAQLIAKAVAAKRNELINSGMTLQQANATADAATGATLGSLANIAAAFQNRVETASQTSEGQAKGITAADNAESIAMRLPSAKSIGDSVVLYSSGEITLSELAEELVESDLEKAVAAGTSLDSIRDNLIHVQKELQAISPDIRILPKKKPQDMTRQDIIEAYSTLQAVDIIHRADRLPVSESARAIIKYALGQSQLAQTTRVLGDAWASYANSEAGQQYLATSGKTISDLLDAAGISQSSLYSDLRVAEEDRIAVEAAQDFNPISATEQEQKDLDTAAEKADQAARTNTEAGLPRTEIPAEESATGEPLPVDPLETADNDPSTGEYSPSPLDETATDPAFNGITSKSPFGITTGMMPPANLTPHPALANTQQVAAADFSPQYNPNAKPILALRMPDGSNLIVAGRTRRQIALADPNCKAVKTTLIDYDPAIHTDAWVQMTNAGEHIINRTATTEHFRTYFTHNPITHAQAIEQGLVPIDPTTGQPTAAYTKGRQLAIFKDGKYSHASQQDADVLTGEVPIDLITHSDEVPQFKTNKAGNRPGKDGVVYALPGEYRTHDPIHIWQRTDGTLVIISGRHRLAKAKEAGATHIPATVYPETDIRNAAWARTHDAEQNVLDNQASVADTAKYVRGENPKARKLTEEETKQFTRKGSNSEKGSFIGLHGSDHLMNFLSAGVISDEYAFKIAKAYPDDHDAQNLAVDEIVLADKGIREAMTAADIYRDNKANKDDAFSALFKSSQQEEDFNRFLGSYAAQKIRELGTKRSKRKAAATDRSVREHKEAGISFDDLDRTRKEYANYTIEQHKWRNASQYPELRQEAYEAFLKTAEGAQDYFDFGSLSIQSAKQRGMFQDGMMQAANAIITEPSFAIRAIHATPHNFRKFSTDFMGSGEGVQAYGWGLYFAENLLVNRAYFNQFADLNKEPGILLNGKRMRRAEVLNYFSEQLREIDSRYSVAKAKEQMSYVLSDVSIIGGGMKGFLERAEKAVNRYSEKLKRNAFGYSEYGLETVKIMRDVAQLLAEHDIQPTHPFRTAINYRVELNVDDSNLLLWDKPVSDELFKAVDAATNNSLSEVGLKTARGKAIYETLEGYFESQQEASKWLLAHGYKGIKFLDGISRPKGKGTYNYVIFSGDDIKITAVNESGVWSMEDGWEEYNDPTATFSLRRRVDRNINSLLNEQETTLARVSNFIRKEAARTEKIMGGDTELQRAGVHFAQANAILNALDIHIFSKDLIRKNTEEYRKLRDLRSFISEYITVARKGKLPVKRNTKYGTPKQAIRKQLEEALNAELSSITESIAASGAGITAEQKKNLRELLISKFANENATIVLSAMMETAGNIIDTHLRNSIIDRMETSLRKMQPQLTPSRKFKRNTLDADTQHRLNLALRYLTLNKADRSTLELAFEQDLISSELQKLEDALATPNITREAILKNMPHGIVRQAYEHVISQGGEPTIERVEDEVASMENAFNTYAYLRESTLNDTMRAFLALNNAVYNARFDWELKTEQRRAQDRAYIADAILNIPTEKATQNYQANNKTKLTRQLGEVLQDNLMSASQVFEALRGVAGYQQLATETVNRIANSSIAISLREREIDLSLVESWLRIFKPDAYAALPTDTNKRNRELRKLENTDYTYFQSDCNQIVETDITLTPELTKAAKAIMEERGIAAAEGGKLVLTKGEMLDILLTAEQPHYESNLRAAGYTEEVLNKMRAIVGEELMNYGYAMRDLLLNSGVAEVYQERTGHALPDNPYYWPGSVAYTSAKQEAQPDQSTFAAAPQSSFLKKRVKSMHELRPQNAFAKFRSNMAARNNYIYAQPIVDQWNRLLRNPDFANRLKGVVGDSLVSTVKKALDVLSNAAWGDTIMTDTHTRFFAAIQSGHAISVLAGNISTLLKQLSALNHVGIFAKSGSGLLEWTKAIMRTLHAAPGHNVIGVGEMLESDAFRARWQNNAEYNHFLRMGRGASWGKIRQTCKGLANLGMSAIAGMDIAANALSACVLYNSNYNYYTKQNNTLPEPARKTDAEIRNQCMQDVNNMLELAAQPLRQSQKALLLATSNSLIVKGTFYMATEVVNKLGMAQARSLQTYHKTGSSFKAALSRFGVLSSVGLPAAIIGMAIYAVNNGMPDDDDELLAWLLSGAAQGVTGASLLGGMPVVGPAITNMFNAHAYKNQQWSQLVPDAVKVTDHFSDLYSMLKTSNSWTNAELAKTSNACLRDLAFIANGAATCTRGIPYLGTTLSATANALLSLTAASNATLIPTATADTLSGNKNIPNSKNSTRKKAHKQSIAEALITKAIADDDYEKRKKKRTSERSRHTRKENSKKKAAERKSKAKNNS